MAKTHSEEVRRRYGRIKTAARRAEIIARETPLQRGLREHNEAVVAALKAREDWMDAHMTDFAKYKVGDVLYNLANGQRLGTVTNLYRPTWGHSGPREEESMHIEYEYQTGEVPTSFMRDNTSRQMYLRYGTREELLRSRRFEVSYLEGIAGEGGEMPRPPKPLLPPSAS